MSDTAPIVPPTRRKIQEVNSAPYDDLPGWFQGLRSILEDITVTGVTINVDNGAVHYHITIVKDEPS